MVNMGERCSNCGKKMELKTKKDSICNKCKENKNYKLLGSFVEYCCKHRHERFWQVLRNWVGSKFIYIVKDKNGVEDTYDTFYWENKCS